MKYIFLIFLWKNLKPKPLEKEWLKKAEQILKSHRKANEYLLSICYIPSTTLDDLPSQFCLKFITFSERQRLSWCLMRKLQFMEAQKLTGAASVGTKIQTSPSRVLSWCHMGTFLRTLKIHKSWSVFDWNSGPLQGLFPETLVLQYSCWTDGYEWILSLALNWDNHSACCSSLPTTPMSHCFRAMLASIYMRCQGGSDHFIARKESRHPKLLLLDHGGGIITFLFFLANPEGP